jgi:hypothetical protein
MCREFGGSVGALGVAPPSYPHEAWLSPPVASGLWGCSAARSRKSRRPGDRSSPSNVLADLAGDVGGAAQPSAALKAMILTGHSYWPDRRPAMTVYRSALPSSARPSAFLPECLKTATQPVPFKLNAVKQMLSSGAVPAAMAAVICTMVKM